MKNYILSLLTLLVISCGTADGWQRADGTTVKNEEITLTAGDKLTSTSEYKNFIIEGKAYTDKDAEASLLFHTDGKSGYEVIFRNGAIDGTRKSGSLAAVRNLYRSLAEDSCWFDFQIAVRGKNIAISIYDNSENSLGFSNYDTFYAHATDTLRGLYKASSEKINIYNIADELYCYELKTSIYVTPANQYYVNDIQLTFGDVTIELPNTPQNLSANANSETSISLSWTSAKNATSYNVYRGTEKLDNVTATSYSVEGLTTDTEYCFSITALNDNGESDKSAEACAKTLKEVQAPANLQAWAPDFEAGVISLKWDIAAGASSYSIYRDNEFLINVTENTYKDTAINDLNRTYCYTVISVSANGIESDKSNEACAQPLACIGLNELASSLNVYPNPVKDKLYIETEVKIENVAIYTITGIMVGQQTTDNGQQTLTIDLSELNSGIYFVKISTDNGEIVKRIVKRI